MPYVTIYMYEGRALEQKRKLVAGVTEAIVKSLDMKPEQVNITLIESKKENVARAGRLTIDKEK